MHGFSRGGLVGVEISNAFGVVGGTQSGINPVGKLSPLRFFCGIVADRSEDFAIMVAGGEGIENLGDASKRGGGPRAIQRSGGNAKRGEPADMGLSSAGALRGEKVRFSAGG